MRSPSLNVIVVRMASVARKADMRKETWIKAYEDSVIIIIIITIMIIIRIMFILIIILFKTYAARTRTST